MGMPATSIENTEADAHITAEEQQARRAAPDGALPDILNHIQRYSQCREEATMF